MRFELLRWKYYGSDAGHYKPTEYYKRETPLVAKVSIKRDGRFEREFPLARERIRIGRAPDCEIHIDDPAVSGKHAMLITILEESFVQDLGSTNGTYVNGESVEKRELQDGDVVTIGSLELTFHKDEEDEELEQTLRDEAELEKTIVVRPGSATYDEGSPEQTKAIEEAEDEARKSIVDETKNTKRCFVKVLTGAMAGKRLEMRKPLVTLGRPGLQVAVISRRRQGYFFTYVEGAGDQNYPMINNEPSGREPRLLKSYDVIELAGIQIQVIIE